MSSASSASQIWRSGAAAAMRPMAVLRSASVGARAAEAERGGGGGEALVRRGGRRRSRAGARPRLEDRRDRPRRRHADDDLLHAHERALLAAGGGQPAPVGEAAGLEGAGPQAADAEGLVDGLHAADRHVADGEQRGGRELAAVRALELGDAVADRERARRILEAQEPGVGDDVVAEADLGHVDRAACRDRADLARGVPVQQRHPVVRAAGKRPAFQDGDRLVAGRGGGRGRRRDGEGVERAGQVLLRATRAPQPRQRGRRVVAWRGGQRESPAGARGRARAARRGRQLRPGRGVGHRDAGGVGERRAGGAPGADNRERREGGDRRRRPRRGHRRTWKVRVAVAP